MQAGMGVSEACAGSRGNALGRIQISILLMPMSSMSLSPLSRRVTDTRVSLSRSVLCLPFCDGGELYSRFVLVCHGSGRRARLLSADRAQLSTRENGVNCVA